MYVKYLFYLIPELLLSSLVGRKYKIKKSERNPPQPTSKSYILKGKGVKLYNK